MGWDDECELEGNSLSEFCNLSVKYSIGNWTLIPLAWLLFHRQLLFVEKLIAEDLYFFDQSVGNIITDGFINRKCTSNKKKYLLYSIVISLGEYDISLTKKPVCNSIVIFSNITDETKPSMIK